MKILIRVCDLRNLDGKYHSRLYNRNWKKRSVDEESLESSKI